VAHVNSGTGEAVALTNHLDDSAISELEQVHRDSLARWPRCSEGHPLRATKPYADRISACVACDLHYFPDGSVRSLLDWPRDGSEVAARTEDEDPDDEELPPAS
jgi:hypothetical protein